MTASGPVYYHGSGRDAGRALTGVPEWDDNLFVSHDPEVASLYGPNIARVEMSPDTKVQRFRGGGLHHCLPLLRQAKASGADVAEFHRPHDFIGHVVINPSKIVSWTPYVPPRTAAAERPGPWYHGSPFEFMPGDILTPEEAARYPGFANYDVRHGNIPHVYFTNSLDHAAGYARTQSRLNPAGRRNVYEVDPLSVPEADPYDKSGTAYRDAAGVRVVRRINGTGSGAPDHEVTAHFM